MNINRIKFFAWVVSAAVTAGIGYYVYEFRNRAQTWQTGHRIPVPKAKEILESAEIPEGPVATLVDRRAIERSYYFDLGNASLPNLLDWSGRPPKEVIVVEPEADEKPVEPTFPPIGPEIRVMAIFQDPDSPDRGVAYIKYKNDPPPNPEGRLTEGLPAEVRVGDRLKKPFDYATVKAVRAKEKEIVFAFDDEARPDETVSCAKFDIKTSIHVVTNGQPIQRKSSDPVPRVNLNTFRPERTTKVDEGQFIIGLEDQKDFAQDFGGIIAREVRHGRHWNSKTKKYDGIELKEVKPGGRIAHHGGQSGDVIKSINGHPVTSSSEAISFVKNNQDKYTKWIVVVENKGKERTMTFESPPDDE